MTAARPLRVARGLIADADPAATDGELLRRYAEARDEAAFAELVRRNGPLVLRACRSVLGPTPAAEDAFQAAFLLLARKSAALGKLGSLAGWLHAAAVRTARTARRSEDRRRKREQAHATPATTSADDLTWREVRERLDAELTALPEAYRLPLVLCYLQELSYEDAARRAGCTVGALRGRLERGKERLRRRLARYGLPLAAPVLVLGRPPAVSAALAETTLAVTRAGLAGGMVPPAVAGLLGPTARAKLAAVAGVCVALLGLTLAAATGNPPPMNDPKPTATAPPPAADGSRTDRLGDPLPDGALMRLGTRRFQIATWPLEPVPLPGGKQYLLYDRQPRGTGRYEFRWMDAVTGVVADRWELPTDWHAAGVSADGRWLVLAESKYFRTGVRLRNDPEPKTAPIRFRLYDMTTRQSVRQFAVESEEAEGTMAQVTAACVSADGKWVATVNCGHGRQGRVRLWDAAIGGVVWSSPFKQPNDPMFALLGFTPGAAELVLRQSENKWVHVVDVAKAQEVRTFATITEQVQAAVLARDGSAVVMGTYKPDVFVFDLKTGAERTLRGHKEWARRFAFSPDGRTLVTGGNDPYLLVRDWPSGEVRRRIEIDPRAVSDLFVSGDGKFVDVLHWWEKSLARYDLDTGKRVERPTDTHRAEVLAVTALSDGSVLSFGSDGTLRTWDPVTGRQLRRTSREPVTGRDPITLTPDGKVRRNGSVSPDGRYFAGDGPEANTVNIWDERTGKVVASFPAKPGGWWTRISTAFSPDGSLLATTTEGFIQFRDVGSWRARGGIKEYATAFEFSPDGRSLLVADLNDITVWEVATQKPRWRFRPGPQLPSRPRFSPDGRLVAWAMRDGSVMVHDSFGNRPVATFRGHDADLRDYAFTPDGRRLVTASDDCTLLVWDVAGAVAGLKPTAPPTEADLRSAADALASADAEKAFAAVRVLVAGGDASVGVLRPKLRPAAPTDAAALKRLLADLDSDDFATREKATAGLIALGERAEGPVHGLLAGQPSPEARRRAAQVLEAVAGPLASADRLREVRAVEVLEWVATPAAAEVLTDLSKGDPSADQTRDATAALRRLGNPLPRPVNR